MTTEIVQGDSGNIIELIIQDGNQVIDLTNSTVQVVLTYKSTGKTKQVEITDPVNGLCQFVLTSEDTMFEGIHSFQATVTFSDGRKFTSNIQRFTVNKKMGYIPSTGGGGSTEVIGGNNGHILVNGIDVKVYDDATVTQDITNLKNNESTTNTSISNINNSLSGINTELTDLTAKKHTHSNLSTLNLISTDGTNLLFNGSQVGGSEIVQSATNGNIKADGLEIKVYDEQQLVNEINSIKNMNSVKRLGVSSNGNLTIDGVEVTLDDPTSPIDGGTFTTTYNTTIVDGGEF